MKKHSDFHYLAGLALCGLAACAGGADGTPETPRTTSEASGSHEEPQLEAWKADLLETAYRAYSAMPERPHLKNRSRGQEQVIELCLELGQPALAKEYVAGVGNWRKGAGLADLAFHLAGHGGDLEEVQTLLDEANRIALAEARTEGSQAWRVDRIRVKIARTFALLGQQEEAEGIATEVVDSEWGKVRAVEAASVELDEVGPLLATLEAVGVQDNFDRIRNLVEATVPLFERFYADATTRESIEASIRSSWDKTPLLFRVDTLLAMSDIARERDDLRKARALVEEASELVEGAQWSPEDRIGLAARIARKRFEAGEEGRARREAAEALGRFDEGRERISAIFRAEALIPVAEALHVMGDTAGAESTYRRALEEGAANPNARPRCEDMAAVCLSLVRLGHPPGDPLLARLHEVAQGLKAPW